MALATAVVTALAVGVGSLTGSRAVTLTAIIGWQTIASGMLYLATFLGAARDLVLAFAVSRFQPGPAIGTRANPGSTNALNNLKLPMPAVVALLVILGWLVVPAVAGAWRTQEPRRPETARSGLPAAASGTGHWPGTRPRPGAAPSRGSSVYRPIRRLEVTTPRDPRGAAPPSR